MITSKTYYTIKVFSKDNSVISYEGDKIQYNIFPYAEMKAKRILSDLAGKGVEVDHADITLHVILFQEQETHESTIFLCDCERDNLPY